MIGRTLTDIRAELEGLAEPSGEYYVQCGRTGERPVPVDGRRFPDRETAVQAVRVAHAYRATLRRYDPRAPWYDFVVCESDAGPSDRAWSFPPTAASESPSQRALVAYCHDLAGAVFEALSASDHAGVERAVMDEYLAAAERTPDRDRLCLQLLATMATELQSRLPEPARADALQRASAHLPATEGSARPVRAALAHLRSVGLIGGFALVDGHWDRPRAVTVRGYELQPREGRLPTLPLSAETVRRTAGSPRVAATATPVDDGWRISLSAAGPTAGSLDTATPVDG
ncbi:hypothetical protein C475_02944 [Halosimplex carlsbadense 2-9-1]|uniref:Uncharacterized protein n=1 Tax=Halosimplex carlsbadense 2-9-1 TaxID=797114 RepID=M0D4P9_9EURY|nr:hypothetical protein [Halosimplex carlsbadense]ELZ29139.1 hypothetical protein C475_02944 [Halosimplex carlsbadense 2-9-1]